MAYAHKIRSKKCWNQYTVQLYHILSTVCSKKIETSGKYLLNRKAARVELTVVFGQSIDGVQTQCCA